jgi:hypothetical protein
MNPCGILTGLRGQRGKVMRWMVYDGIVRDALDTYLLGNAVMAPATGGGGRNAATAVTATAALSQRGFWQWSDVATTAGGGQ